MELCYFVPRGLLSSKFRPSSTSTKVMYIYKYQPPIIQIVKVLLIDRGQYAQINGDTYVCGVMIPKRIKWEGDA